MAKVQIRDYLVYKLVNKFIYVINKQTCNTCNEDRLYINYIYIDWLLTYLHTALYYNFISYHKKDLSQEFSHTHKDFATNYLLKFTALLWK